MDTEASDIILPSDVRIPLTWGECPAIVTHRRRKYAATVSQGTALTLQAPGSAVSLGIPQGTHGAYMSHVATDFTQYAHHIPEEECIVSPLLEVERMRVRSDPPEGVLHTINMPHCVRSREDWKYIKVRHGTHDNPVTFSEVPPKRPDNPYSEGFWVEENFIRIQTRSFSPFICTCCKNQCHGTIKAFLYGDLRAWPDLTTSVLVKVFLGSFLYSITDFENVSFNNHEKAKRSWLRMRIQYREVAPLFCSALQ